MGLNVSKVDGRKAWFNARVGGAPVWTLIKTVQAHGVVAQRRAAPGWLRLAVPLLIYGAMSWLWFGDASVDWRSFIFAAAGNEDPVTFTWFLNWWPWALAHGVNPVVSHAVWFPHGNDLAWATSVPLAALAAAPCTWLAGPVLSYNVLTLGAPVLAACTAFLLARELTGAWSPAVVGGYLFGFSSYEIAQMLAHLNLDLTFLVPLAVWLCVRRYRGKLGRNRFVIGMAVLLLAQLGLSLELLATSFLLGAIALAIFLLVAPARDRPALLRLGLDIAAACLVMAVLASPYLVWLAEGWRDLPANVNPPDIYSEDLMNFLTPTSVTYLGHALFAQYASNFTGDTFEQGSYIGLPLVLIAAIFFWENGRKPYVRALLAFTLVAALFSLGPRLHVGRVEGTALPWALLMRLPLLGDVLPCRFAMFVSLATAIAAACWLAGGASTGGRIMRYAGAGVACLFLAPNPAAFVWSAWPQSPFFTPQHVAQALGPAANVLILPFKDTGPGMAWQVDAGMRFTQAAGYIGFNPPRSEAAWSVLPDLEAGIPGRNFANDLTAFCITHRVDDILLGPGTPPALAAAISALGWPGRDDDGVRIVQPPAKAPYHYISGDYWPSLAPVSWMGRQITLTTVGAPAALTIIGGGRPMASPVGISVTDGIRVMNLSVTRNSAVTLRVPADTSITLHANAVFNPSRIWNVADNRDLSVLVAMRP